MKAARTATMKHIKRLLMNTKRRQKKKMCKRKICSSTKGSIDSIITSSF